MSVIIRLQNLPWTASALDIRQYFHGLGIPEGGVHIVGGEQGDAFIAFSTDEDARQAMLMDGGKIKDAVVRLHLSSRSQMQKVIEDARQGALQPFMQIPVTVPQSLPQVQSTATLMGQMAPMNHMAGLALATGHIPNHMLQVLPGQLSHSMMSTGAVGAPGSRTLTGVSPSIGDPAGAASAATSLGAARFTYGSMVMGGAMTPGGGLGAGASLPISGSTGSLRPSARDVPPDEDADDRKDDDIGRRRDRRERSRSRDRRDRDRYRDRDRGSYDRRRRSRSRDRDRRRRSRSTSRSRDRSRRSSRDKRDHERPDGLEVEPKVVSGSGLLKTPERPGDGPWNQSQSLRGRDDGPAAGMVATGASGALMGSSSGRLSGGPIGLRGSLPSTGMTSSLHGAAPDVGLQLRNGPGGFGGMASGNLAGGRRPDGSWMRDELPQDIERRQDGRYVPGAGPLGPAAGRMGSMFSRPGVSDGDSMTRSGMPLSGPSFMGRGAGAGPLNRPALGMPDRPALGMPDRFRPNGFERNSLLSRPAGGMTDRLRPNPIGTGVPVKDRFQEIDNGDEDYEEQDMDMEDPFPDPVEEPVEERNNQPVSDNSRNRPFGGREDRYPYRDDRYDRPHRNDRDRDRDRRNSRDRYGGRSSERERERRDDRYDRYGKDEFGRDRPDERYSRERGKDRPPEPNTCIEIRNMAPHTGYGDIRRYFQPLVIPGPGLKIINDSQGRRTGVAYIRFGSRRDRESALTYAKHPLKGESVVISDLSDEVFESAIDGYLPERDGIMEEKPAENLKPAEEPKKEQSNQVESASQYTCVVVHNAPNYAKDDDIRRVFKYCSLDIFWEVSKEGRRQKLAYVKFKKTEDCKRFLFANYKFQIGNNDLKVVGMSEKDYDDAKTRVLGPAIEPAEKKPVSEQKSPEQKPSVSAPQPTPTEGEKKNKSPEVICVPDDEKTDGPQEETNNVDEKTEQEKRNFVPQPSPQRPLKSLPTDCVCLRNLPPNAIDRDILDFFSDVGLVPLKIHIMVDYMGNPTGEAFCEFQDGLDTARAATKNNSHMGKYIVSVIPVSRPEMNNALNITNEPGPINGPPSIMGGPHMGQPRPPFHGPPGHFNHGVLPGFMGVRGPGGQGVPGSLGPGGPGPMMRGANNHSILGHGPPMGHPHQLQLHDRSAEGFGRPGCVVACENIPFRAEIDDILEYFGDFNLSHDSVIRRYNERGLATGDARISFNTPMEAQTAMRDLKFKKLQGRMIYMRLM